MISRVPSNHICSVISGPVNILEVRAAIQRDLRQAGGTGLAGTFQNSARINAKHCPRGRQTPGTDPGWHCLAGQLCSKGPAGAAGSELGTDLLRRGCRTRVCSTRRRDNFGGTAQQPLGTYMEVMEKMEPGFAQHCMVGGQEVTGVH